LLGRAQARIADLEARIERLEKDKPAPVLQDSPLG